MRFTYKVLSIVCMPYDLDIAGNVSIIVYFRAKINIKTTKSIFCII